MESRKYTVETLSPLCITTNNKYSEMDIVVESKEVKILNIEKLISEKPEIFEVLYTMDKYNKDKFRESITKLKDKSYFKYSLYFYNKTDFHKMIREIHPFIKTGGKVYIPGSSIKGAFRLHFLKYEDLARRFIENSEDVLKKCTQKYNKEKEIEIKQRTASLEKEIMGNPERNMFRFISFSDTNLLEPSVLRLSVVYIFSINGQEIKWFSGVKKIDNSRITDYKDNYQQSRPIFVEVLPSKNQIEGNYKISDNWKNFSNLESFEWIKRFNLQGNNSLLDFLIKKIKYNVERRIKAEIDFFEKVKQKITKGIDTIEKYLNFYRQLEGRLKNLADNEVILQMGFFTGFLSKTIFDNENPIPDEIKKIKYKNYEIFPKTRRVIISNDNFLPLGWVKITFH